MQGVSDTLSRDQIEELVREAQDGEAGAFAGLYEHFHGKILRYVSFKTGDAVEAEDITEEVFLRMLESISSFRWKGYPFSAWLFRIAHNLIVDHFRKRSRQKQTPLEDASGVIGSTSRDLDSDLDTKLTLRNVYKAMEELTKLQKEVISLRFAAGLSVHETAEAVGKKDNAVKALQHAGIKKLRTIMNPDRMDEDAGVVAVGGVELADG